ncbi:hypothetical protein [Methylacidiphilum sp. Yel]|uniref:hypothetical protein n=1 Tax=Methylacidiphilum sp. Yel TaxID=1847730 RepID=UPI001ABCC013|nr:hypothetical protein [Methylacidiphilum sp. Yel]
MQGDVDFADAFRTQGMVSLFGARIDGALICIGAQLENPGGLALNADGATIKRGAFFTRGFRAEGVVALDGANIGSVLLFEDAHVENPTSIALQASKMAVQGNVSFSNGTFKGSIWLLGAKIGGSLRLSTTMLRAGRSQASSGSMDSSITALAAILSPT